MPRVKNQYYIKGVDNQKRSDITFEFKRMDLSKFKKLSDQDKLKTISFLSDCRKQLSTVIKMFKIDTQ